MSSAIWLIAVAGCGGQVATATDSGLDGHGSVGDAGDSASNDVGVPDAGMRFDAPSSWSIFDTTPLGQDAVGYDGATFDGRYVYFAPYSRGADHGVVMRYDTQSDFASATSWSTFDPTTIDPNAAGFAGAAFDGRFVYFIPSYVGKDITWSGVIARYDTQASFGAGGSWLVFDTTTVDLNAKGFYGSAFDGRYLYLVPSGNGGRIATRYDTQSMFTSRASWTTFDLSTLGPSVADFGGAIFDGRYVYLVPRSNGLLAPIPRFDTFAKFGDRAGWSTFDPTSVNPMAKGFTGGAFDGRYVYFVPHISGSGWSSLVLRYDVMGDFGAVASWSTFETSIVNPCAAGFVSGGFDGRNIYFAPFACATSRGVVTKYDALGAFTSASWCIFDTQQLDPYARAYQCTVFDGRYMYFAGSTWKVARLAVQPSPTGLKLPAWHGSFL